MKIQLFITLLFSFLFSQSWLIKQWEFSSGIVLSELKIKQPTVFPPAQAPSFDNGKPGFSLSISKGIYSYQNISINPEIRFIRKTYALLNTIRVDEEGNLLATYDTHYLDDYVSFVLPVTMELMNYSKTQLSVIYGPRVDYKYRLQHSYTIDGEKTNYEYDAESLKHRNYGALIGLRIYRQILNNMKIVSDIRYDIDFDDKYDNNIYRCIEFSVGIILN